MAIYGTKYPNHSGSYCAHYITLIKDPHVEDLVGSEGAASKEDNDKQPSPVPIALSIERCKAEDKDRSLKEEPFPTERLEDTWPTGIPIAPIHDVVVFHQGGVWPNHLAEKKSTIKGQSGIGCRVYASQADSGPNIQSHLIPLLLESRKDEERKI